MARNKGKLPPKPQAVQWPAETRARAQQFGLELYDDGRVATSRATPALIEVDRLKREQQYRGSGNRLTSIPAAPRFMVPDAAGRGVTRNAYLEPVTDRHLRQYARKSWVAVKAESACATGVSVGCELLIGSGASKSGTQSGLRVQHRDHYRGRPTPEGFERYIEAGEDMLREPCRDTSMGPAFYDLMTLSEALYRDYFTLNKPVLEFVTRGQDVVGLRAGDGGIVVPAWDMVRRWVYARGTTVLDGKLDIATLPLDEQLFEISADVEKRQGKTRGGAPVDLTKPGLYVVYRDGIVDGEIDPERVIVMPRATSTDIGYAGHPPSMLQLCMEMIALSWAVNDYNGRKFTDAAWTSQLIAIVGEGYDTEAVDSFVINFVESARGYQRANQPMIIHLPDGSDIKTTDLRPPLADGEFKSLTEQIDAGVCAILRRHPEIINGTTVASSGGPSLNGPSEEIRVRLSREEGHVRDVRHMATIYSEALRRAVHPDLVVVAEFPAADRKAVIEIMGLESKNHKTVNEVSVEQGMEPMGFFLTRAELKEAPDEDKKRWLENPWNYPTDPNFIKLQQFVMGLNQNAANGAPQVGPDGKPQAQDPMTMEHAPGLGQAQETNDGAVRDPKTAE